MSISFKVYLISQENGQPMEVRRFLIDSNAVTSFAYIKQRLESIFPVLQGKPFSLLWKDADGDFIDISTDEELIIALTELKENVKILTVKYSTGSTGHHRSVTCDGCSGPVIGFRYKCLQCLDYDLCSSCEYKKVHLEHFMLRFPSPEEAQIGRRLAHGISRNFRRACNDYRSDRDRSGRCSFSQQQKPAEAQPSPNRSSCPFFGREANENASTSEARAEFGEFPMRPEKAEEIIKLISDGVSGFFQVLGLNDMDMGKEKKDGEQTPKNSQTQTTPPQQNEAPSAPVERSQNNTPENNGWTLIDSSIPAAAAAAQTPMEVSAPKQPEPQQAQASPIYPTLTSEPVPDQASTSYQPANDNNNSRISGEQFPNALRFPDIPNRPLSLEERIDRTYQALLTMGFNSNGGWLRQLVEYKKGNLDQVLDVLQPHKRS